MNEIRIAGFVVKLNPDISLSDVDNDAYEAVKEQLKDYSDTEKAQRVLMMQILGEAISPDRYENIKNDDYIQDIALLNSGIEDIVNNCTNAHTKTSAQYGHILQIEETEFHITSSVYEDNIGEGFYFEIWNNNIPENFDASKGVQRLNKVIETKYSKFAEILYQWEKYISPE